MLKRLLPMLACFAVISPAALLRIEVAERTDVLDGKSFGAVGPYERIIGKAYFAVDPKLAANQIISDIQKAPRNENGLVEFSSDIYILKPRDPAHGNGDILFEVSNRGGKGMLAMFNRASSALDPRSAAQFGDAFLLEQGFTLAWLGWEFDVPRKENLLRLNAPVARDASQPVTGLVRSEFIPDRKEFSFSLADREHIAYPALNPGDPNLTLTVRDRSHGPRRTVPRNLWKIEDGTRVAMPSGLEPGKIYEIVYTAQDPVVSGLGPAAVRDLISFLKYGGNDVTVLGDQKRYLKRAYGFGISQSGRFLRTFVYYGFNQDEKNQRVFDGVMPHVAGGGRGSFNHRFAQPSRVNYLYPTDIFPFTDVQQTDPETGITDGLLSRAQKAGVVPKIFYTNSSCEYWGRAAALIHSTVDGKKDAPIPETTRIYFLAGGQHGPAAFPPVRNKTLYLTNSNDYRWAMRALLMAMDRWVKDGKEPPPSQYPRIADDKLVAQGALQFPSVPGVSLPQYPWHAYRLDFGPEFRSAGIIIIEPPKIGKAFPHLFPQVDRDGNETSGVRMPGIQAPLGTYTGWNLRAPETGSPDEMLAMQGSWFPFARSKSEREKKHDPRLSLEERYSGRQEYLEKFKAAALSLIHDGFLLERDVPKVLERGAAEWEYLTRAN